MAPRIELFVFRYGNRLTGKPSRARYVATREEIAKRHDEREILGPADIRDVDPEARYFTLHTARGRTAPIQRAPARTATSHRCYRRIPARGISAPIHDVLR